MLTKINCNSTLTNVNRIRNMYIKKLHLKVRVFQHIIDQNKGAENLKEFTKKMQY